VPRLGERAPARYCARMGRLAPSFEVEQGKTHKIDLQLPGK
jgi:hypothetical protein